MPYSILKCLSLPSAEISSFCVKLLPLTWASSCLCYLPAQGSGDLAPAVWGSDSPLLLGSAKNAVSHLPSLHTGQVRDGRRLWLGRAPRDAENRTQICCLSLSGSICYCSAPVLFIPPHAWLEAQVDEFSIQVVNMLQPPHIFLLLFRQIYKLVLNI